MTISFSHGHSGPKFYALDSKVSKYMKPKEKAASVIHGSTEPMTLLGDQGSFKKWGSLEVFWSYCVMAILGVNLRTSGVN